MGKKPRIRGGEDGCSGGRRKQRDRATEIMKQRVTLLYCTTAERRQDIRLYLFRRKGHTRDAPNMELMGSVMRWGIKIFLFIATIDVDMVRAHRIGGTCTAGTLRLTRYFPSSEADVGNSKNTPYLNYGHHPCGISTYR